MKGQTRRSGWRRVVEGGAIVLAVVATLVGFHRRAGVRRSDGLELPSAVTPRETRIVVAFVRQVLLRPALHEWLLLLYVGGLLVAVHHVQGEGALRAEIMLAMDLALLAAAIGVVRGGLVENRFIVAIVSRVVVVFGILGSFFQLDVILPAARLGTVDDALFALDLRLVGVEPALLFDRWVSPATTEWFSFFYFSYFVLLAAHVLPFVLLERRLRLVGEFALGLTLVYCIGQLTYVLVPGFGPYRVLAFEHELTGTRWWPLVLAGAASVNETSRTDIFPSLHTAGPVFLTVFSFRHRSSVPFRYSWPIVGLFATQIVIATMFLRWHYLIDVVAGAVLAVTAAYLAKSAVGEEARRASRGLPPVWTHLEWGDLAAARPRRSRRGIAASPRQR